MHFPAEKCSVSITFAKKDVYICIYEKKVVSLQPQIVRGHDKNAYLYRRKEFEVAVSGIAVDG